MAEENTVNESKLARENRELKATLSKIRSYCEALVDGSQQQMDEGGLSKSQWAYTKGSYDTALDVVQLINHKRGVIAWLFKKFIQLI